MALYWGLLLTQNCPFYGWGNLRFREVLKSGLRQRAPCVSMVQVEPFCLEYSISNEVSSLSLWGSGLPSRKARAGEWGLGGAHPHSQGENAASAEPMSEEGPVGIDCDGDVALLVVT